MTEVEWLGTTDPVQMLDAVYRRVSDRKLRLFGCACLRLVYRALKDPLYRRAVETAERYADQAATEHEIAAVSEANSRLRRSIVAGLDWDWQVGNDQERFAYRAAVAAESVAHDSAWYAAADALQGVLALAEEPLASIAVLTTRTSACMLLREVVGNPSRPSPPPFPTVLNWQDGTVTRMARGIYEERAFDRLPVLHDALLDAGCDDEAILAHCRGAGPHVRGCWVIDLILGKS